MSNQIGLIGWEGFCLINVYSQEAWIISNSTCEEHVLGDQCTSDFFLNFAVWCMCIAWYMLSYGVHPSVRLSHARIVSKQQLIIKQLALDCSLWSIDLSLWTPNMEHIFRGSPSLGTLNRSEGEIDRTWNSISTYYLPYMQQCQTIRPAS